MTAKSIERNIAKFENLPEDFKTAIQTSEYDKSLATISQDHKLHIDQSSKLETLLAGLIFGEVRGESIVSEIEEKLNVSNEEAKTIAIQMNNLIIEPIKENLKKIQSKED